MKVLVTGAAGFIGSAVGRALADEGNDVTAIDLMLERAHGWSEPRVVPTVSTSATPRRGAIFSTASTSSCIKRRW